MTDRPRTESQLRASRANGALSRGPTTPDGKRRSSGNSARHRLLSNSVVLKGENEDRFLALLASYVDEHRPATQTQMTLVETMAVARWRQLRVWDAQKVSLDRDIALQNPATGPVRVRAVFALGGSAEAACQPALLLRYEAAFDRQFFRALNQLRKLQSDHTPSEAEPYFPPTAPVGNTWQEPDLPEGESAPEPEIGDSGITERTQQLSENAEERSGSPSAAARTSRTPEPEPCSPRFSVPNRDSNGAACRRPPSPSSTGQPRGPAVGSPPTR